jgi:pilus assembly protein Flp/PilA
MMKGMTKIDTFTSTAAHFSADENGATAIEYAMVASGIAVAIASTVYILADKVKALFTSVSNIF